MIHEVRPPESEDRIAYVDGNGDAKCIVRQAGLVKIPAEFKDALRMLRCDLELALECVDLWGGVPAPVAMAILRGQDLVVAALDMGLKSGKAAG
jgi:hypothetical protein